MKRPERKKNPRKMDKLSAEHSFLLSYSGRILSFTIIDLRRRVALNLFKTYNISFNENALKRERER